MEKDHADPVSLAPAAPGSTSGSATATVSITVTAALSNPSPTLGAWAQRVMLLLLIAAARHGAAGYAYGIEAVRLGTGLGCR